VNGSFPEVAVPVRAQAPRLVVDLVEHPTGIPPQPLTLDDPVLARIQTWLGEILDDQRRNYGDDSGDQNCYESVSPVAVRQVRS
jgi:hypothetical protein